MKKLSSLVVTGALVAGMVLPTAVPTFAARQFTDVPADAYYAPSVDWTVDNDVTSGTTNTTFSPANTVKRSEMITFLWRAAGTPDYNHDDEYAKIGFNDVKNTDYFATATRWGIDKDIITGTDAQYGKVNFSGKKNCTRGQIATMIYRAVGSPDVSSEADPFTDVDDDDYFADAVTWAYNDKVISGKDATTFAPNDPCTRAEAVTMIYRLSKVFDLSSINAQDREDTLFKETYDDSFDLYKDVTPQLTSQYYKDHYNLAEGSIVAEDGDNYIAVVKFSEHGKQYQVTVSKNAKVMYTFYDKNRDSWTNTNLTMDQYIDKYEDKTGDTVSYFAFDFDDDNNLVVVNGVITQFEYTDYSTK